MSFSLTSRLNRAAKRLAPLEPRRIVRALRHHHAARTPALANRSITLTLAGPRLSLPALLRKPPSLRRANGPRRLLASAGWFAFGAR